MRVLITGASGLLGAHLVSQFACSYTVIGTDRHPWWGDRDVEYLQGDLGDPNFVEELLSISAPDVLVHCAGMVDVDACERYPDQAYRVNRDITRDLAARAASYFFIYISTDAVFSGDSQYWSENQATHPLNVYARSNFEGEREIAHLRNHLILRTNFYGWSSGRKKTAAEWLYTALLKQDPITLFDDFFFTPIYVSDLARVLKCMIQKNATGLFHLAGRERVSKYDFGATMARLMGVSMDAVQRGSLRNSQFLARRSPDISLSTAYIQEFLDFGMPGCEEGIRRFLADRGKPLSQR